MVFAHRGLKVRRRQVFGMGLMRAPFHEQAVADAAEQARDEHRIGVANAAAIVVVGNVQALVQTVFDAGKAGAVQFQPLLCVQFLGSGAG